MVIPAFTNEEEGKKWLINKLEKLVKGFIKAKNYQDKLEVLRSFDLRDFDAEEQFIGDSKIKEFIEYREVKNVIGDFFEWLEIKEKINSPLLLYTNTFYTTNQNQKMLLLANSIKNMPTQEREQFALIINLLRSLYELNLQSLISILETVLEKKNIKKNKDYGLFDFEQEFKDYSKLKDLKSCFKTYLRNPATHESWIIENGKIRTRNKGKEEIREISEYVMELHYLLFFKTAVQSCAIERASNIINKSQISEEQIQMFYENFKKSLDSLKNNPAS